MDSLKILITGAGSPGIKGTIYSLKNNFDKRPIIIYGTDCNEKVVGSYLCDKFYQISHSQNTKSYISGLI